MKTRVSVSYCESWSFGNDFLWNAVIFGVDNSSLRHSGNHKNNFLILTEGPADSVNDCVGEPEKKIGINFSNARKKFCLSLHCHDDKRYLYGNKTDLSI